MPGLRVIGGTAKGRRLASVPGDITRPITDRAKESLFNIIGADIQESTFLDLFAGTGSVGIEALSRGANWCRFVDVNGLALEVVKRNLKHTGLDSRAEVRRAEALKMLEALPDRQFDYVFVAPPQYKGLWIRAVQQLDRHPGWLAQEAWVIVQIHPVEAQELALERLVEFERRKYGSVQFLFFHIPAEEND